MELVLLGYPPKILDPAATVATRVIARLLGPEPRAFRGWTPVAPAFITQPGGSALVRTRGGDLSRIPGGTVGLLPTCRVGKYGWHGAPLIGGAQSALGV